MPHRPGTHVVVAQKCAQTCKLIQHTRRTKETRSPTQDAGERINLRLEATTTEKEGKVYRAATQGGHRANTKPNGKGAPCRFLW